MFWIGQFTFINLSRPPSRPQRRLVREKRPGANAVSYWHVGKTPEPFALASARDIDDADAAADLVAMYQELTGTIHSLGWAGEYRGHVIVLSVEPLEGGVYQTLLGIGGVMGASHGMARCRWELEWVDFLTEEQG